MPKASVFTMKLESDLRAQFMAAAEASHRPASQVVREMMREFVQREHERQNHGAFLREKVEAARVSVQEARGRSADVVEAEFAERRIRTENRT